MSISKKFYSIVLAIVAVFALVGCQMPTSFSRTISEAEVDLAYIADTIFFTDSDLQVSSNLEFTTSTVWKERITFEWFSSNENVISTTGKVTRPEYGQGNAEVTVKVVITAEYTKLDDGTFKIGTVSTEKEWTFTVLEAPEVMTIARILEKAEAGELVLDDSEVIFTGVIIAYEVSGDFVNIYVHDGTEGIYVYTSYPEAQIGAYVEVSGPISTYGGCYQISNKGNVKSLSNELVEVPAEPIKMAISDYIAAFPENGKMGGRYYNFDAKLSIIKQGSYTNVYLIDPFSGEKVTVYYKTAYKYVPGAEDYESYLDYFAQWDGKYINITVASKDFDSSSTSSTNGHARVALTNYEIVEIEEPKLTDEQQANIILNLVALESEYRKDFELDSTVTWEIVSGTGIEIVEGKAVVTQAAVEQVVVLKASATYGEATVTKEFTVVVPPFAAPKFELDKPYHFAMVQGNLEKTLYLTGEMDGYYYATTEDVASACEVVVKAAEGGYYIIAKGQYMAIIKSGNYTNVKFYDTLEEAEAAGTNAVWTWNGTNLITVAGGTEYFLGTKANGTYTTFSAVAVGSEAFAGDFYPIAESLPFELNTPYHLMMVQSNAGKTVYLKGGMNGYYMDTTENVSEAVDVIIVASGAGYNLMVNGEYVGVVVSGTHVNGVYYKSVEEAAEAGADLVWSWNDSLKSFTMMVNDEEYVLGTRNDKTYTTVGPVLVSKEPFYVVLTEKSEGPVVPEHTHVVCPECGKCLDPECPEEKCEGHKPVVEPVEGKAELTVDSLGIPAQNYKAGTATIAGVDFEYVQIGNYGDGIQMRDKNGNTSILWNTSAFGAGIARIELVYSSTKDVQYGNANCVIFSFGNANGEYTYSTKLSTEAGVKTYTITPDAGTYTYFKLEHDLGYTLYWDSITIVFEGGSSVEPEVPTHEHKPCEVCGACLDPECPETKCEGHEPVVEPSFGVVSEFKEGVAYKFGLVQGNKGNITLYLTGNYQNTYYGEGTEDLAAAADIYVVAVEGGYNLKLVKVDGTVLYINVVPSGTHRNIKFENSATSVWTYNADLNTFTTLVEGTEYYVGTYGTYTTISPSSVDKASTSFVGHLYGDVVGTPEPPVHEHNFVEGKCECGEVDPNYVAPHKHVACETCGLCTAEDCTGAEDEKCAGHEEAPVTTNRADFETIVTSNANGDSGYKNTYTTTAGWVVTNSAIQTGGASVSNPQFPVIGENNTYKAVCLNGKVSAAGTLTSPTLSGGISVLNIAYTKMFTDTALKATITVTEVATGNVQTYVIDVTLNKDEKYVVYPVEWVLETPIVGEFTISIVNNCPSNNSSSNKDRITILSVEWTGYEVVETPKEMQYADLESFTKGDGKDTSYTDRTNAAGWVIANGRCDEQADFGVEADQIILNGKNSAVGTLTSSVISGGVSKVSFNYGYAFSENGNVKATVSIKDAEGNVIATTTLEASGVSTFEVCEFVWELDTVVEGDFVLEIVNGCPSNSSKNKDRLSIWNLGWLAA